MSKRSVKSPTLFIIALSTFHLPGLFESLWYDEAAVLANSELINYFDTGNGLNWLQSVPIGYHILIKLLLSFDYGLFLARLLSLLSWIAAVYVVDSQFLKYLRNQCLRFVFIVTLLVNSVSLRYATDIKPYALEAFFSVLFLAIAKQEKFAKLMILSSVAPLFSSTVFILGIPSILISVIKSRNLKFLFPGALLILVTVVSSLGTSSKTRQIMSLEWFENSTISVYLGLKSFIGGILWLPTSGTGWLSDGVLNNANYRYLASGLLFCLALILMFLRLRSLSEFHVLLNSFLILALLAVFKLLPPAGRLIQGFAILFSTLVALALDTFNRTRALNIIASALFGILLLNNMYAKMIEFSTLSTIKFPITKVRIYSTLELAPELQFRLSRNGKSLEPNILGVSSTGRLEGCREDFLQKGDLYFVDGSKNNLPVPVEGMEYHKINNGIGYYKAREKVRISIYGSKYAPLECKFKYRNPEKAWTN